MPSTQQFRKRIRSVKNTSQITRAMEMVSSVKMQKAIKGISTARSYVQNSQNMLVTLAKASNPEKHLLLAVRPVEKTLLIFVASDRGLCGSYNSDLARRLSRFLKESKSNGSTVAFGDGRIPRLAPLARDDKREGGSGAPQDDTQNEPRTIQQFHNSTIDVIAVGKKGAEIVRKMAPESLIAEFQSFDSGVTFDDIVPITKIGLDGFVAKKYDKVVAIYSHFISSLKQSPVEKQILPITHEHIDLPELWEAPVEEENREYKFEPNADVVLGRILPQLTRIQVYGLLLEANASDHSARMVAMKSATDNARDLMADLTLMYNSIRQDSITREIAEIAGAAESMR